MIPTKSITLAVAAGFLSSISAFAQNAGALVDALVKKGILTDQEAEEIRADMSKEFATTPAGKLNLNSSVTEMKLYGDLRLRYQYDNKDGQLDPFPVGVHQDRDEDDRSPSGSQRSRWRFRLRLNADFKIGENFFGGVELSTGLGSDSANQTFENGFNDYSIFISKAFVGWTPNDWATIVAGKMPNPFYTTDLLWDSDVTPNGFAQSIAFHKMQFWGEPGGGYTKDGKAIAPGETAPNWELTLNAGQFIFDDNLESAGPDNDLSTDAWLFQTQLVGAWKFDNGSKFTIAPGWITYVNGTVTGAENNNSFNDNANVSGATRNLNVLLLPGDYSFKIGKRKAKFLWDFAYNIEGRKRTEDILDLVSLRNDVGQDSDDDVIDPDDFDSNHSSVDNFAFLAGVQLGENKKAGDWSILANYRQIGIGSIDPNYSDSNFALGEFNTRGFRVTLAYNFTDFAIGAVNYYKAWNLRDDLVGGEATGGNAIGDSNVIDVLQVDFAVKF